MQTISLVPDADVTPLTDMVGPLTYCGPSAGTVRNTAGRPPLRTSYVPERQALPAARAQSAAAA